MSEQSDTFNPVTAAAAAPGAAELPDAPPAAPEAGTPPPTEAPKAAPAAEPPKVEEPKPGAAEWAKAFEQHSARDVELRTRESEIKRREADLERYRQLEAAAKENPLEALKHLGVSADDVLKWQLNGGKPDPHEEIAALKKDRDELRTKIEQVERAAEARRQGAEWERDFSQALQSDDYRIVREWDGAADIVRQRVAHHYREKNELLSPKEQLDTIRNEILSRLDKMKQFIPSSQAPATPTTPEAESPKREKSGPKTLTPNLGATPARYSVFDDDEAEMARIAAKYA